MHLTLDEFSNIKNLSKEEEEELDFCLPGRDCLWKWPSLWWRGLPQRGKVSCFLCISFQQLPGFSSSEWELRSVEAQPLSSLLYTQEAFINAKGRHLSTDLISLDRKMVRAETHGQGLSVPFTVLTPALLRIGQQLPAGTDVGLDATRVFLYAASWFLKPLSLPRSFPSIVWLFKNLIHLSICPDSGPLDSFPTRTNARGVRLLQHLLQTHSLFQVIFDLS